ncbi:sugar phosphate isomerase/epimerase [Ramlibacter ginsenosidimutans]|uniref:Sugar phosphate isomerase/epimerase n=1 Tax=Ramlibacter ginsenosidimutans TaxID=502333 RepID=A0A934WMR2_9BURK|nr:sugar phosphate isomerase/epimerase family protein [Ramlibacter ginsenosidimutans]MBK6006768.1 sugar phosphate isomerase/epimerase [Ramlibacter ginsenosidimutans]
MRFALCNEVLQPLPFPQQCKLAADLGYDGLELAPFTLADDPTELTDAEIAGYRRTAEDHGLTIFGLHWLLVAPAGLSIVSPDAALRQRTKEVMVRLVELCAALGGSYLVHGSPKQRSVPEGSTREQALERARECLSGAAAAAARCGVTYCLEPLARRETDLFNTVEECAALVEEIGSPALRTMVDCSAAGQTEKLPVHEVMAQWMPRGVIGHVQVNDPNRRGPGQGALDFGPVLRVLRDMEAQGHFPGILGVEPFDYVPDGPGCAAHSIGFLRGVLQGLQAHG